MKIILFGGSNSILSNGLQRGFKDLGVVLYNKALGGTDSMQNLYELIRIKNSREIVDCDLIVCESNVNERGQYDNPDMLYKQINWFYQELSMLNKKVLVLILPHLIFEQKKIVNNIHKKLSLRYGFNVIDMQFYYEKNNLLEFANSIDNSHQLGVIMRSLAKNIVFNSKFFLQPSKLKVKNKIKFLICSPSNCISKNTIYTKSISKLEKSKILIGREFTNSFFSEKFYRIDKATELSFSNEYIGGVILGIHTWNNGIESLDNSKDWELKNSITSQLKIIDAENTSIISFPYMNSFRNVFVNINKNLIIKCNVVTTKNNGYMLDYCDIINFFIAMPQSDYNDEQINFEALANENIEISKEYNFNHLIPPVEWYKEIVDEYCSIMDPRKLAPLQTQITNLTNEKQNLISERANLQNQLSQFQNTINSLPIKKQQLEISNLEQDLINKKLQTKQLSKKLGIKMNDFMPKITMISPSSAKARIQNQLSYKLGQAIIVNSKSILGYIRMPFVLSYIKDKHKQEQKAYQEKIKKDPSLILPPLESYPDYQEALKLKNHLSYKLGEALIQANKTWYGGGVYQVAV
ncbi:hypothetical protein O8I36_05430 [Campylobacter lari]|uniref:hypothetical protein n=1 Tax=Campylobacter lari TaxID=201 RepID=UPI00372C6906